MKVFVLVLTLTLVGCQNLNKQPVFNQNRCYTYKYELRQVTRVPAQWHSGAGIKLLSKVEICGSRSGLLLIRIYSPEGYEYKSTSPRPEFIHSPELTHSFAAKLGIHAAFLLENGRVRKIMAPANYSVDGLNIYKGFVNIMQLTIKDKLREYTLQEDGIEGLCNATYTIPDSKKENRMLVMKAKNLNECLNRVEKIVGAVYATPCTECKENSQAAITSSYYIKPTQEGPVIDRVDVSETHQYMPFNGINGGRIVMEASQNIQLIKVEQHRPEELPANFKDCGSLAFQFSDESQQLSTPVKQLEHQIVDDLLYLSQHMWEDISRDCTKKFQRLTQNMHKADYELYDSVYKKCSNQPACRRIFWDVVASADNPNAIRLLKHKYEQQEVTSLEAAQIVIISFHYSSPSLQILEEAKSLLRVVHQHPHDYLFRTVFLAYASLCHKYCANLNNCPESALKPVNDFANEVLSRPNEDDIILLLRGYENLQHRSIMKPFTKFLPGYATSDFSLRVQHVALLCLKGFAKKDPTWVRRTSMQIFLNYKLDYSTRIFAVMSLLSAKPGLPVLMMLAKSLAYEPSAQVEQFVISSLTTLATSTAPDLQAVASASKMALNIMSSKSEQPKYATAKFLLLSLYKESLMAGVTTEVFILNNAGSVFPNFMSTRFETNIFGNKFSPLEVGVGIPHFSEIILNRRHEAEGDDWSVNARRNLKMRPDQKVLPREPPTVGGYIKMFGQNIITAATDMKTIMEACQDFYRPEHSGSWITNLIYNLQRGFPIQWAKALTSVDASYAVAVGTGLPLERSLTHVAITSFTGNAKVWFTPELPQNRDLSGLSITDVRLKTDMSLSIDKRMIFRMGIRNSLLQAGLEEYAKLTVNLPIKAAEVAVDIKNKRFKLELPPCKEETNIFSLSTRTYAVVGNGEEAPAAKLTPVLPPQAAANIMNWNFKPDSASENKLKEIPYSTTNTGGSSCLEEQCVHHSAPAPWCLNATTFGSRTCIKYSAVHAGLSNAILNRFVGDHNITCTMYPVRSEPSIKVIQVTVQLGDLKIEKSKNRIQNMDSSSESTSSSSSRSSDEDADNKKRPLDVFSSHEVPSGQHSKNRSKSPKKPQSSGNSRMSSESSSSDSSNSSENSSSSNSSSSSSSSSSRSESNSRKRSEIEEQKGRQENRKRGSRSLSDRSDHGEVEREHNKTPGKHQSHSRTNSNSGSAWLNQEEKRKSNTPVVKPGKISQKNRARDKNDRSEGGAVQEETGRSSSSSSSSSSSKSEHGDSSSSHESSRSSSEGSRSSSEGSCSSSSSSESKCRSSSESSSESSCSSSESSCSSSSESSSSDSSSSEETNFLGKGVSPSLTFVAQAIKSNNEKQGYQATVYIKDKPEKLDMQLVMVDLNDVKQMSCLYVGVWPYKAQASLSTEKKCQYKNLEIKVSKGHLARNPAIQVKMKSRKLPDFLKKPASMAKELLPSLASRFGFNSICQNNTSEELVVGVAASSPRSVFVICKLPEETLYKEGINVPWTSVVLPPQHYPSNELTAFNFFKELASRILKEDEAVCQVEETSIRTFDNMRFNGSFNENCRTLIAQECTEEPQFSIITRKTKLDLPREVYIHLPSVNITISPASNRSLLVLYNGEPMDKEMYEDYKADITVYRNESTVLIKAPQHGLENVTYDCETLWVTVSSRMRGKTCGLCGSNDGEKRNEGHMPNHELAYNDMALFHSWLLEDSDCVTGLYPEMGHDDQTAQKYSIME